MKKRFSILLALAMTVSLTVPAFADEPDYTTGTPWPCIDLDGVVTEETTAELKDNFALAVNKDKILALEIPEGYTGDEPAFLAFIHNDDSDAALRLLIHAGEGSDTKVILCVAAQCA